MAKKSLKDKKVTPEELKEIYPLYPTVRREYREDKVVFKTLVRKRFGGSENGKYYLIPLEEVGTEEAKVIHSLHAKTYKFLMLGVKTDEDVLDSDQTLETKRLLI